MALPAKLWGVCNANIFLENKRKFTLSSFLLASTSSFILIPFLSLRLLQNVFLQIFWGKASLLKRKMLKFESTPNFPTRIHNSWDYKTFLFVVCMFAEVFGYPNNVPAMRGGWWRMLLINYILNFWLNLSFFVDKIVFYFGGCQEGGTEFVFVRNPISFLPSTPSFPTSGWSLPDHNNNINNFLVAFISDILLVTSLLCLLQC